MSASSLWWTMLGMGVITFLLRISFIGALGRYRIPHLLERALRFVPAAVLSALVFPAVFYKEGILNVTPGNEQILAAAFAVGAAWYTKSLLATIAVGMGTLWLLRALF